MTSRPPGPPSRGARARARRGLPSCLAAIGLALGAQAQEPTLDAILGLLAQHPHGHVLYTEQVDSAVLEHPLHTSGELFFDAPDRLEKRTLEPAPQQLIAEGDQLTLVRGRHRASMRLGDYPQLSPLINGLRATLAGDRASLEKNFRLEVTGSESSWTLSLQPLASESKPVYRRIEIRGQQGEIREVVLDRSNGERTTMSLRAPADS